MNSYQIENPNRGFTFRKTGPLDMRFHAKFGDANGSAVKARDVINNYSAEELSSMCQRYADEPYAQVIADAIVRWRNEKERERSTTDSKGIQSTLELRYIIEEAVSRHKAEGRTREDAQHSQEGQGAPPRHSTNTTNKLERYRKIWRHNQAGALSPQKRRMKLIPLYEKQKVQNADSVMRCFQALRIETNDELRHLESFLRRNAIRDVLNVGGRLVMIAFHPGEDGMVRRGLEQLVKSGEFRLLTPEEDGLRPTEEEVRENSKSRTVRLRAVEKVK
jgi:16S rRNA (cytosine1402-N4)-methyltransferase